MYGLTGQPFQGEVTCQPLIGTFSVSSASQESLIVTLLTDHSLRGHDRIAWLWLLPPFDCFGPKAWCSAPIQCRRHALQRAVAWTCLTVLIAVSRLAPNPL